MPKKALRRKTKSGCCSGRSRSIVIEFRSTLQTFLVLLLPFAFAVSLVMSFSHSVVSEDWDQSMQNISGVSEFNQGQRKYLGVSELKKKKSVASDEMANQRRVCRHKFSGKENWDMNSVFMRLPISPQVLMINKF